ncbi:hypothetical protein F0562_024989 [Nyssa sinensis]|uniref:E2F/DP family winged-helix DNA-binding domain-containing protein n=1 Tax=Nyssa sinensis TaxID=561372 RepID=A0A5J5BCT5_9ASTE|nr:hypothetical protein F0562_024989 [Nyssa sinensis]
MALSSSTSKESGSRNHTYCRKQKSLGVVCTNFLRLYNRDGIETIGLDDAASQLEVEMRRIYDIVNVLESIGVLSRKAKNQCSWRGFGGVPKALQDLKEEGLRENFSTFQGINYTKVPDDDEDERFSNPSNSSLKDKSNPSSVKSSVSSKTDNRKEKSLGLLTQNFVKLFLCSNVSLISLDDVAMVLLGDALDPSMMRAKVRRLYDIANVLSSMNFIEKTQTRKPVFRWLGMKGKFENGSASALVPKESKKRAFGTQSTNTTFKRSKMVSPINGNTNQVMKMQLHKQVECGVLENEVDKSNFEQDLRPCSKNYQFGPFAPVRVPKVGTAENNKVKQVHDWESLASTYHPLYHKQQALTDLYAHYLEAWKSWYSEIAGKNPIQQSPNTLFPHNFI